MMEKSRKSYFPFILWGVLIMGCIVVYLFFDPTKNGWMPKCPFHLLTGWNCPACGLQRAIYALLHGRWMEAFSYNYFMVLCLPYIMALFVAEGMKIVQRGEKFIRVVEHPIVTKVFLVLCVLWWIIRNLLQV